MKSLKAAASKVAASKAGKAVSEYGISLAEEVGIIETEILDYTPLTEENLRRLNSENETLGFTVDDLLDFNLKDKPINKDTDPNSLSFTANDVVKFSDLEEDWVSNYSIMVAPGSKQFSEWMYETETENEDDAVHDTRKRTIRQGLAQAKEIFDITRDYFAAIA